MGLFRRLFGVREGAAVPPDVARVFEKVAAILRDDTQQNALVVDLLRSRIESGEAVDVLPGARGDFGRCRDNPIPVNGPIGEVTYLSRLVSAAGKHVLAHRLGSIGEVDLFETVTMDADAWDVLFFHMYHPRKSARAPSGYELLAPDACRFFTATSEFVEGFPHGMGDALQSMSRAVVRLPLAPPGVESLLSQDDFSRPAEHLTRLAALIAAGLRPQAGLARVVEPARDLEDVQDESPESAGAEELNALANDLCREGRFKEAVPVYTEAITLDPEYAEPLYNRGKAKLNLGDYRAAIEDFDRAISLAPDDADAYNNRGIARRKQGDARGAIVDYDSALRLNSQLHRVYLNRGLAKLDLLDIPGAVVDLGAAARRGVPGAMEALAQARQLQELPEVSGANRPPMTMEEAAALLLSGRLDEILRVVARCEQNGLKELPVAIRRASSNGGNNRARAEAVSYWANLLRFYGLERAEEQAYRANHGLSFTILFRSPISCIASMMGPLRRSCPDSGVERCPLTVGCLASGIAQSSDPSDDWTFAAR